MELVNSKTAKYQKLVNKKESVIHSNNNDNPKYLYPNGHRMTHQIRWFKGSSDRGLKDDFVA
tara:strand:+ start:338 stop:523 length:186 start_codon:yes stop_codon:yes gene_type:complete